MMTGWGRECIVPITAVATNESWLTWEGWSFVGSAAGVLSLIAIVLALLDVASRRRYFPPGNLLLVSFGRGKTYEGDDYEALSMVNTGRAALVIVSMAFVDCEPAAADGIRIQWHIGPGGSFDFGVTSGSVFERMAPSRMGVRRR